MTARQRCKGLGASVLNGFLQLWEPQIPHRLKPVRDDSHKLLDTAQLKLRPFKT
jgi:hypothetical protein